MSHDDKHGLGTKAIHAGQPPDIHGAAAPPIYQTSTFSFENAAQGARRFLGEEPGYIYTRLSNPTIDMLEDNIAALEGGKHGLTFSSGMAATNALIFGLLGAGEHFICGDTVYGTTRTVVENYWSRFDLGFDFINTADLDQVESTFKPNTRLLFLETPANPTLRVSDIAACAEIAHRHGALFCVDNTFMSPILQRPMEHGADIVLHSMTKFINGHSDVVAGIVVTRDQELHDKLWKVHYNLGANMDPHQAWLVLRGVKTLKLRVLASQANAIELAKHLEGHSAVDKVFYPGLEDNPGYEVQKRQTDGPGGLISFELKGGYSAGQALMDNVKLMTLAVSLGGVETLIQHPASMTHSGYAPEDRLEAGITDGLVRISTGCEDVEDLIADIDHALSKC